jgi:hypothetical protein
MLFSVAKLRCSVFLFADRVQYRVMQKVHPTNHFVISKDFDELLKMAAANKRFVLVFTSYHVIMA